MALRLLGESTDELEPKQESSRLRLLGSPSKDESTSTGARETSSLRLLGGTPEKIEGNIFSDVFKSLARGVEKLPVGPSKLLTMGGEELKYQATAVSPNVPRSDRTKLPRVKQHMYNIGQAMSAWGKNSSEFYTKLAETGREAPNPAIMLGWKHPFRKVASLAAENLPALGVAAVTGGAAGAMGVTRGVASLIGASTFAPQAAGDFYEEAVKQMPHDKARDMALVNAASQVGLENIALGQWMKGGNLVKRVARTAIAEGPVEEGTQQLFENGLKVIGWKGTSNLYEDMTEGLAESIAAGAVSGAALGSFNPPSFADIKYDIETDIRKEGKKSGNSPEKIDKTVKLAMTIMDERARSISDSVEEAPSKNIGEIHKEVEDTVGVIIPKDIKTYKITPEAEGEAMVEGEKSAADFQAEQDALLSKTAPTMAEAEKVQPGADLKGETAPKSLRAEVEGEKIAGVEAYHYSDTKISEFKDIPEGTWFTSNKVGYQRRGRSSVQNKVTIPDNLNLANKKQATDFGMYRGDKKAFADKLKAEGFDGVKMTVDGDTHYMILDKSKLSPPQAKAAPADALTTAAQATKVTQEAITKDKDGKSRLQKEMEAMEHRVEKADKAKSAIVSGDAIFDVVQKGAKNIEAEVDMPQAQVSEILADINAEAGTDFTSVEQLDEFVKNWKSEKGWLNKIVEEVKPEMITKQETTILKDKIKNIDTGIRQGKVLSKQEVKSVQDVVIKLYKDAKLDIPVSIKSIQTHDQLHAQLPSIMDQVVKLEERSAKSSVKDKLKTALDSTKIIKKSGKLTGRFTPEGEAVLGDLRNISKMNTIAAKEALDKNMESIGDKIPTFEQALTNRMLSYMADTDNVSSTDMQQMVDDINFIKQSGRGLVAGQTFARQTRDADNKQQVFDVLTKGEEIPEGTIYQQGIDDKGLPFKKKVEAARIKFLQLGKTMSGWNDLWDMLSYKEKGTAPGRGTLNKVMKVSHIETLEKKIKRIQTEKLVSMTKEVFGFKSEKELLKQFRTDTEVKDLGTFTNSIGKQQELKFSKAEARKLWMEMQDPTLAETIFGKEKAVEEGEAVEKGMHFTPDMKNAIESFLDEKDKAFVQEQLKFYTEFYEAVNPIYKKMFGIGLGFNPLYSPIAREGVSTKGEAVDFLGEMQHRRSIATGNLKSRVKNVLPLKKQSDLMAIQKHIIEMSHFIAWAEKIQEINAVMKDPAIRNAIKKYHGKAILPVIDRHIETFTTGGKTDANDFGFIDKLRVNFTTSVLGGVFAGKPALMTKQLVSFMAFADEISPKDFAVGVADFIAHPIRSTKILAESEVMKARGGNLTRDMQDALKSQEFQLMAKNPSLKNQMMFMTRFGDRGAIMLGGWSVYKSVLARTGSKVEAMEAFEEAASGAQQSADLSQQSVWQKGGSFAKLFTMFTSSQNQYFRKEMGAIRGLMTGRGSVAENAKKIVLYHFILPMLFQFVASGFKWDDEEQLRAGILGSFNGVFILKDVLDSLVRSAIGMKDYGKGIALLSHFDKIEYAIRKLRSDDISDSDIVAAVGDIMAAGLGMGYGLPAKDLLNKIEAMKELESGEIGKGTMIMLGWSPYAISQGEKKSSGGGGNLRLLGGGKNSSGGGNLRLLGGGAKSSKKRLRLL